MLGDHDDAVETAFERIQLRPDLQAQAVLFEAHLEDVLRPPDAVRHLPGLAAQTVVDIGQHLGDRPRGVGVLHAVVPEVFQPREGRIVGLVALRSGILPDILLDERGHQVVAVGRKHLPGQPPGPEIEPPHGVAGDTAPGTEQQRIGRRGKGVVHAAAQNPHVGQRHVGNALHRGVHPGTRGADLPPHGSHPRVHVRRQRRDRVGRPGHLARHVVVKTARHGPHVHLLLRQGVARGHGHLQQRTSRQRRRGEKRCGQFHPSVHTIPFIFPARNYLSSFFTLSRM